MKKLLLVFLSSLVIFVSVVPNFLLVKASPAPSTSDTETWYNQSFANWYGKVYDGSNPSEIFGERYTAAQVQWIIYGIWSFLINGVTGPQNAAAVACLMKSFGSSQLDLTCIPNPTSQGNNVILSLPQDKPVASKQSLWGEVFADRPMSGITYVKERIRNFSLIPVAHAAPTVGFGYNALEPIRGMWTVVANISFGFFVIVAVVFAFMIMFRVKLNPQTVITVQSAIPKIVFSMILAYFSYAIAGFMIDFMYVIIGLISIIGSQFLFSLNLFGTNWTAVGIFNFLVYGQPFGLNIQAGIFGVMLAYIWAWGNAFTLILLLDLGLINWAVLGIVIVPLLIIFAVLAIIIGFIMVIWNSLKTFWALLKAFVNIVLLTIFAPIQIVLGTFIPNFGFGTWLRNYLAALSVFVVTGALLLFSYIFLWQAVGVAAQGLAVTPGTGPIVSILSYIVKIFAGQLNTANPFTGNANGWPPLLGIGGGGWIGLLLLGVSFVLFTMIPKATEIVQGLMSGKPFAYGTAIGEAWGPVAWAGGQAWNQSGASDIFELAQALRKGRLMRRYLRSGTPVGNAAETFVGGPRKEARKGIDTAMDRYDKSVGRAEEVSS